MKIEEILNEYLGKQTKVALMELPNIAKELNYHFDCERAFYNRRCLWLFCIQRFTKIFSKYNKNYD